MAPNQFIRSGKWQAQRWTSHSAIDVSQIEIRVMDRTNLILDIFAQHARTREGILQVFVCASRDTPHAPLSNIYGVNG